MGEKKGGSRVYFHNDLEFEVQIGRQAARQQSLAICLMFR